MDETAEVTLAGGGGIGLELYLKRQQRSVWQLNSRPVLRRSLRLWDERGERGIR